MENLGLGRIFIPDNRDSKFLLKSLLPRKESKLTHRYWNSNGWWGNQLQTPHCVGYSWTHWVEDGPVTHKGLSPIVDPIELYQLAQKVDQWEGENYDGTSVRAGAKVLQDKGLIESYLWAWDINTLIQAVLEKGPVVVGTNWYRSMFTPDINHKISIEGSIAGGHAYKIDGANTDTELFRIKNSWGRNWSKRGFAYIGFKDMERLINEDGEICMAIELKL